jgi:DNA-binding NarL/FixJ family response regulator
MIVDDEPHVRLFISLIVRSLDTAVVHQASCGESALMLFQSLRPKPKLVILDINMPGIGGIETLRRLRSEGATCPIVMITSLATRQIVEDALAAGGTAFIRKDTPRTEISRLLREVLNSSDEPVESLEPVISPPAPQAMEALEEVFVARRDSAWDQDWFRGGV